LDQLAYPPIPPSAEAPPVPVQSPQTSRRYATTTASDRSFRCQFSSMCITLSVTISSLLSEPPPASQNPRPDFPAARHGKGLGAGQQLVHPCPRRAAPRRVPRTNGHVLPDFAVAPRANHRGAHGLHRRSPSPQPTRARTRRPRPVDRGGGLAVIEDW
jgi:hypothetical protein